MGTTITKEQATEALVDEKQAAMQVTADQEAAADVADRDRQDALLEIQERAAELIKQRAEMIPQFIESLEQVGNSATELRALRDEFKHLNTNARNLGGSTNTAFPRAFGRDPLERNLLRKAIKILSSVGGYV